MRIVIVVSGSGGHLFCGLSVAEGIREKKSGVNVFFLSSGSKVARKLAESVGFKFYNIYAKPFCAGRGYIKFLLSQFVNFLQSGILFLYLRPDIAFSTGGFASIGIVFWSRLFNRPCVIHEQNLLPGKANLLSAKFADKILVSFNETENLFKGKRCILTGMPVRFKSKISHEEARQKLGLDSDKFTILVMGGSKGAHRINQIVVSMLEGIPKDLQFVHLTGTSDLDFVRKAYGRNGFRSYVEDFSNRMDVIYSASNLVIGRAGSGMLSEITFFGLPSILIPYPYSRDRHQYKNAGFMEEKGAAVVVPEDNISTDKIVELIKSRDKLEEMAKNSARLTNINAVDRIVDEIMDSMTNDKIQMKKQIQYSNTKIQNIILSFVICALNLF